MDYAITRTVPFPFAEAYDKMRAALEEEGFGILTEIDVQAKMKEKLGRDMPAYTILGACAPPLAWDALQAEPRVGVLLPCNVCVYQRDGQVTVSAMEPDAAMEMVQNDAVAKAASEAGKRLRRAVDTVASATAKT